MRRSSRKEPLWPIALVVGVVAGGLVLGAVLSGDRALDGPARALEAEEFTPGGAPIPTAESRVRVEVLNGGGVPGVAGIVRDLLRDEGFDVVYFGNASSFGQETSVVIDRTNRRDAARSVAHSLGVNEVRVDPDTTFLVDVTVLVGTDWNTEDWQGAAGFIPQSGGENSGRSWWDIRRFF